VPLGDGRHALIAAEDAARFIAKVLTEPAAHAGKTTYGPSNSTSTNWPMN